MADVRECSSVVERRGARVRHRRNRRDIEGIAKCLQRRIGAGILPATEAARRSTHAGQNNALALHSSKYETYLIKVPAGAV